MAKRALEVIDLTSDSDEEEVKPVPVAASKTKTAAAGKKGRGKGKAAPKPKPAKKARVNPPPKEVAPPKAAVPVPKYLIGKSKPKASDKTGVQSGAFGAGAKRLLKEFSKLHSLDTGESGYTADLVGDNMYLWDVRLYQFDKESNLAKDLEKYANKTGVNNIHLRFEYPSTFPFEPPVVRLVRPRFTRQTSFVFDGAICIDTLMNNWSPASSAESIILQVRQLFMEGGARIDFSNTGEYPEAKARKMWEMVKNAHNFKPTGK